jgi:hypothetical protein
MIRCVAIVQEGKRKGCQCEFDTENSDGYCNRHQRNKVFDVGKAEGKQWCRFFFRGCNNVLDSTALSCAACRAKNTRRPLCNHSECTFQRVNDSIYCGKHARDVYRDEEVAKGIKYCDIDRGCLNVCDADKSSCNQCLEQQRQKNNYKLIERKEINEVLKAQQSNRRLCHWCGSSYETFQTSKDTESTKCLKCVQAQNTIEEHRVRNRHYQSEQYRNIENFYKDWGRRAYKRGLVFELTHSQFVSIVLKPCTYCGFMQTNECIGIDRIDNSKGYTVENSTSCCKTCNRIKHAFEKEFFLEKVHAIVNKTESHHEFYTKWHKHYKRTVKLKYDAYKQSTINKRKFGFHLTESEWNTLLHSPCYLCGFKSDKHTVGIDRVDNRKKTYTIDNCKPCCKSCNVMKHTLSYDDFVNHMQKIAAHQSSNHKISLQ